MAAFAFKSSVVVEGTLAQVIIDHRPDTRPVALKLYASLRQQLPDISIAPNLAALADAQSDQRSTIVHSILAMQAMIIIVSDQWGGSWLQDANAPDFVAIHTALASQRTIFLLRYNGSLFPAEALPNDLAGLAFAISLDFNDNNLYQVSGMLASYLRALIPQNITPMDVVNVQYRPNPKYPGSGRTILKDIAPASFQHPLDRLATENLNKVRGFDFLVSKFMEFGVERVNHTIYAASSIAVSEKQYSKLYKMLREACAILDIPLPELYVIQLNSVNAFTYGYTRPYIVMYTGLLDLLSEDEIMAVIGHELGHIRCKHVLYSEMATLAVPLASGILGSVPGFGSLIKAGFELTIQVALMTWKRRSELSADRAALLVMQQPEPCISMLAKLAGGTHFLKDELSLESFIEQARAYEINDESTNLDRFYRIWAMMHQSTHPFPVERARYLNDWIDGVEYDQIVSGNYIRVPSELSGEL